MHALHHTRSAGWVVKIALLATLALVITEFVTGVLAHSLALISDGWHNFTDLPTLVLSWVALYLEQKSPDHRKTFGYQRASVLAAFVNGLILVAVALFIGFEGYGRQRPTSRRSGPRRSCSSWRARAGPRLKPTARRTRRKRPS